MRALLAADILQVWEAGHRQLPHERALTLLAAACPESSREELAALSLGRRDARLLELRRQTFGESVQAFTGCPRCAERLELHFTAGEIHGTIAMEPDRRSSSGDEPGPLRIESSGIAVRFRLPASADFAAAVALGEPGHARAELFRRCVLEASRDGAPFPVSELPREVCDAIERRMAEADPAAEITLALQCPACAHGWSALLDIAAFFWTELAANARRLLREVDALARAYGWREADILALSQTRRQAYLELLAA